MKDWTILAESIVFDLEEIRWITNISCQFFIGYYCLDTSFRVVMLPLAEQILRKYANGELRQLEARYWAN